MTGAATPRRSHRHDDRQEREASPENGVEHRRIGHQGGADERPIEGTADPRGRRRVEAPEHQAQRQVDRQKDGDGAQGATTGEMHHFTFPTFPPVTASDQVLRPIKGEVVRRSRRPGSTSPPGHQAGGQWPWCRHGRRPAVHLCPTVVTRGSPPRATGRTLPLGTRHPVVTGRTPGGGWAFCRGSRLPPIFRRFPACDR